MRTRKHRINFYLNDDELALLKEKCKDAGLSQSALLREMLLNDQIKIIPMEVVADMQKQFRGVGRNINQIAKLAHISGKVAPETIGQLFDMHQKLLRRLNNL
ncbi:MAG: plasmid mobilization relaxosome protein MobC [Agathobaculum sp.]|uniref:plasmid mobilization protein n=1 Tax=Agathobaculum sp. TaxID=2048138 RepID=UPI002A83EB63|nr:plasmid mobilization relaxosome protein MobC [Agathobaculum sp.]MDY3711221.1 plasmid mobilization relaxosome protein MobC [Agathobaculum sp.]